MDASEAPADFKEADYLALHPGIAQVVREGGFRSGLEHYLLHGKSEGRRYRLDADAMQEAADQAFWLELKARHSGREYLAPTDLAVTTVSPSRIAMIGSCLLQSWDFRPYAGDLSADVFVINNGGTVPQEMPLDDRGRPYDLQVVQVPLRSILPDASIWHLPYDDVAAHERVFEDACAKLEFILDALSAWNAKHGLLTFVSNFFTPQRNPNGCLLPKFDIRNPEHFVMLLNQRLEELVRAKTNAHVLDIDRLSASVGRRYVQDDAVDLFAHGSVMSLPTALLSRMEHVPALGEHYDVRWPALLNEMIWNEIVTMYRVARQVDGVKLVVVDLDDTLWNGVSGDAAEIGPMIVEGWPLGFVEALAYLRKRGVLVAILSRNEDSRIRAIWHDIFGDRLRLAHFAAVSVDWRSKVEGMQQILADLNLLPRNVVFIDDSPAERAAMEGAFPGMRVLGRHPYYLRRIMLWSAETQVASVTAESGVRTEMVQAQVQREAERKTLSREEFLGLARPTVTVTQLLSPADRRFSRTVELLNKTNQFNTTGQKWQLPEFEAFLNTGGHAFVFDVTDRYTGYGLVGVVLVTGTRVMQWVMSCRVLGYGVEQGVMAVVVRTIRQKWPARPIQGDLLFTDVNFPARALFRTCRFVEAGDNSWVLPSDVELECPAYLQVNADQLAEPA